MATAKRRDGLLRATKGEMGQYQRAGHNGYERSNKCTEARQIIEILVLSRPLSIIFVAAMQELLQENTN